MPDSSRTERASLQTTLGELARVHRYRYRVEDLAHLEVGWWATPAAAANGCKCRLCSAARAGDDLHLGSNSRIAHIKAMQMLGEHRSNP